MPEKMRPHSLSFTTQDWQTIQAIAAREGKTANMFIHDLIKGYVIQHGGKWQGGQKRGRPMKQRVVRP